LTNVPLKKRSRTKKPLKKTDSSQSSESSEICSDTTKPDTLEEDEYYSCTEKGDEDKSSTENAPAVKSKQANSKKPEAVSVQLETSTTDPEVATPEKIIKRKKSRAGSSSIASNNGSEKVSSETVQPSVQVKEEQNDSISEEGEYDSQGVKKPAKGLFDALSKFFTPTSRKRQCTVKKEDSGGEGDAGAIDKDKGSVSDSGIKETDSSSSKTPAKIKSRKTASAPVPGANTSGRLNSSSSSGDSPPAKIDVAKQSPIHSLSANLKSKSPKGSTGKKKKMTAMLATLKSTKLPTASSVSPEICTQESTEKVTSSSKRKYLKKKKQRDINVDVLSDKESSPMKSPNVSVASEGSDDASKSKSGLKPRSASALLLSTIQKNQTRLTDFFSNEKDGAVKKTTKKGLKRKLEDTEQVANPVVSSLNDTIDSVLGQSGKSPAQVATQSPPTKKKKGGASLKVDNVIESVCHDKVTASKSPKKGEDLPVPELEKGSKKGRKPKNSPLKQPKEIVGVENKSKSKKSSSLSPSKKPVSPTICFSEYVMSDEHDEDLEKCRKSFSSVKKSVGTPQIHVEGSLLKGSKGKSRRPSGLPSDILDNFDVQAYDSSPNKSVDAGKVAALVKERAVKQGGLLSIPSPSRRKSMSPMKIKSPSPSPAVLVATAATTPVGKKNTTATKSNKKSVIETSPVKKGKDVSVSSPVKSEKKTPGTVGRPRRSLAQQQQNQKSSSASSVSQRKSAFSKLFPVAKAESPSLEEEAGSSTKSELDPKTPVPLRASSGRPIRPVLSSSTAISTPSVKSTGVRSKTLSFVEGKTPEPAKILRTPKSEKLKMKNKKSLEKSMKRETQTPKRTLLVGSTKKAKILQPKTKNAPLLKSESDDEDDWSDVEGKPTPEEGSPKSM